MAFPLPWLYFCSTNVFGYLIVNLWHDLRVTQSSQSNVSFHKTPWKCDWVADRPKETMARWKCEFVSRFCIFSPIAHSSPLLTPFITPFFDRKSAWKRYSTSQRCHLAHLHINFAQTIEHFERFDVWERALKPMNTKRTHCFWDQ